jgi:hypothetical protein
MEQAYWLGRERASIANAHAAADSESRLIHFELAGRYSIKAVCARGMPLRVRAEVGRP